MINSDIIEAFENAKISISDGAKTLTNEQFQIWMDGYMHCYGYLTNIVNGLFDKEWIATDTDGNKHILDIDPPFFSNFHRGSVVK